MNNAPSSDTRALRARASSFDAQRSKRPGLGNEVQFSTTRDRAAHTPRVPIGFAAATCPAHEAASAVDEVCH